MKRGVGGRGLSPVIASVLMILLVLVLASIIFLWARGFIDEQIEKFDKPIEGLCSSVDFKIERMGDELEVMNRGNVDIYSLDIRVTKGGDSEMRRFDFQIDAGKAVKGAVSLKMSDGDEPDEIIVYPVLIGNVRDKNLNRDFTCIEAGKII